MRLRLLWLLLILLVDKLERNRQSSFSTVSHICNTVHKCLTECQCFYVAVLWQLLHTDTAAVVVSPDQHILPVGRA